MALVNVTTDWVRRLNGYCATPPVGVVIDKGARKPEAISPVNPTADEWGAGGLRYNQEHLRDAITPLRRGQVGRVYHHSLVIDPTAPATPYALSTGTQPVSGNLYLLESPTDATPYTRDLRRFAVFVPAHYSRTSASGHHAWIHFAPVWPRVMAGSPRGRDLTARYLASFWLDNHVARYLIGVRLLSNFAAAQIDAVFVLPLSRYTIGDGLAPMSRVATAMPILQEIFALLEALEPRMAGPRTGQPTIQRIGVSCNSFGGHYGMKVVASPGAQQVICALVALDVVPTDRRAATRGVVHWYNQRASTAVTRLALYQQPNPTSSGDDVLREWSRLTRHSNLAPGQTIQQRLAAGPASWYRIHRIRDRQLVCAARLPTCKQARLGYFDLHGPIGFLLGQDAFTFCRDAFN